MDSITKFLFKDNWFTTTTTNVIKENHLTNLKEIGRGNFGTVYSAVWMRKKPVAVKVFNNFINKDEKELKDYQEEVNKTSKLSHKNVVKFYGETQVRERNAFVMELAADSLDKIIHQEHQSYSFEEAMRWLMDVAEGVIYMHQNNIIHRDLKPANLLLFHKDDSFIVKISDFGISREKHTSDSTITCEVGTPAYMAPEVIRGMKYDIRCDVYSFGIIMWEVFARKKPFAGMSNIQILFAVGTGQRPEYSIVNCPADIRKLIEKCWEMDYQKRMEMAQVLCNLKAAESENFDVNINNDQKSLLNQTLKEKLLTTSIDKWFILSRLPSDLKCQVRLAAVLDTSNVNVSEALVITEDDQVYWVKENLVDGKLENNPKKIDRLSGLRIKALEYSGGNTFGLLAIVLTEDSQLLTWNHLGHKLMMADINGLEASLKMVPGLTEKTIVQVACDTYHALALTEDGEVFAWGENKYGQLGQGTSVNHPEPVKVTIEIGSRRTAAVVCGLSSSFAVMDNGDVYSWGLNYYGQLGVEDPVDQTWNRDKKRRKVPTKIEALVGVKIRRLDSGNGHVLAVDNEGSLYSWGLNCNGQLGTGDKQDRNRPVRIIQPTLLKVKFVEVACKSSNHLSVALSDDGRCWVWGRCRVDGKIEDVLQPMPVDSMSIHDAIADYAVYQMSSRTMLISNH